MRNESCAIIGCGRVGRALAIALKNAGYPISVIMDHDKKVLAIIKELSPESLITSTYLDWPNFDVLFLAINDDKISSEAEFLANSTIKFKNCVVAHTSGVLTANILAPIRKKGAQIASFHPVQTFSGAQNDTYKLRNSYFALEGEEEAINVLQKMVADIGGKSFVISPELKPFHHLACVLSSNYVITLMSLAVSLFEPIGIPKEQTKSILLPLMKNAVENISHQSLSSSLTGPISRGDTDTVQQHIELLKKHNKKLLTIYAELGIETVKLARSRAGLSKANLDKIESLMNDVLRT